MVRRTHQFHTSDTGEVTADPDELRTLIEECIDDILQHSHANDIRAVGMACFVGNILGVNEDHEPITPLYTYADTQAQLVINDLKNQVDEIAIHQRTGCLISTAYHPAQLYWIQQNNNDMFQSIHLWTDIATHIYGTWFGKPVPCSYSVASWSGLLDREQLEWDHGWLEFLGIKSENLPELADYNATQRGLTNEYHSRWKQLQDVPFYLAIGDGAAANIGSGATDEKELALTIGTTAAIRTITTQSIPVPSGLWAYRVDKDHHLIGGATTEGGSIYQWLQDTLQFPQDTFEDILANLEPGSHNLTFIPLLGGERSPGYHAQASGTIHGIRLSTTPVDIAHAALESIAIRLSIIAKMLQPESSDELVYAGGNAVAASPAWVQIIANAFNRPIAILNEPEVTATGVVTLISQGLSEPVSPKIKQTIHPSPDHIQKMSELRQQHTDLYEKFYS